MSPRLGENGWAFANVDPYPGADVDPLYGAEYIKDLYLRVQPDYEGRYVSCLDSLDSPANKYLSALF